MDNRPKGREKHVTGEGKDIYKRGEGLGTGPVGSESGHSGRTEGAGASGSGQQRTTRGGRSPLTLIILALVALLGGGGAGLSGLLGGGSQTVQQSTPQSSYVQQYTQPAAQQPTASIGQSNVLSSLLGSYGNVSSGWSVSNNNGRLNTAVSPQARVKRTTILGNGQDTVTLMVYMCGTDLESKNRMATSDLQEMVNATIGSNVNLIVYTGGCRQWQNNIIDSGKNQIWKIEGNGFRKLVDNAGSVPMTDPNTLAGFIQFCAQNFPANRNALIFWDHGGGSLSGYGYDEKFARNGSMPLQGIAQALKAGGATFDFIGFDTCLMATLETALLLTDYADYMIASEETEPGVGWYYTNWLTKLSQNTSMPTLEIGKNIIDDFVDVCAQKCRGQQTTLSMVDLAELEATVPGSLKDFAQGTSKLMQTQQFATVSRARSGAREFAASSKIDQVDLVDLASGIGTQESTALAETLLSAIKYNRTSSNMTDAYGLSIYFPYQRTSKVDTAVRAYSAIGIDEDYSRCIQQFASMEVGGQAISGGAANPLSSLLGGSMSSGSSYSGSSTMEAQMIAQMLGGLLGGNLGGVSGLTGSNSGFLGRSLDVDNVTDYLADNQFDGSALVWTNHDGRYGITLSEAQWSLVNDVELNVFYDDGEGYIDLGLDNVFEFSEDGTLLNDFDGTWLAIDSQPVPYYHTGTVYNGDDYTITGRVPCLVNDERANLLLVFDNEHPYGYVAGYRPDYLSGTDEPETETIAKAVDELESGDRIDFVCDYYGYDGSYQDSYLFGDPYVWDGDAEISNVTINADAAQAAYLFTDIYCQQHWTGVVPD